MGFQAVATPPSLDWSFLATQHRAFTADYSAKLRTPEPCIALPGTEEKIAVLSKRQLILRNHAGKIVKPAEYLHHPQDATWEVFWRLASTAMVLPNGRLAPFTVIIDGETFRWACSITLVEGFDPTALRTP
jgi:hypothetical protein